MVRRVSGSDPRGRTGTTVVPPKVPIITPPVTPRTGRPLFGQENVQPELGTHLTHELAGQVAAHLPELKTRPGDVALVCLAVIPTAFRVERWRAAVSSVAFPRCCDSLKRCSNIPVLVVFFFSFFP